MFLRRVSSRAVFLRLCVTRVFPLGSSRYARRSERPFVLFFVSNSVPFADLRNRPQRSDEETKYRLAFLVLPRSPWHYPCFASFSPLLRREIEIAVMSFVTGFHTTSSGRTALLTATSWPSFRIGGRVRLTGKRQFHAFRVSCVFHFVSSIASNRV